MKDISYSIMLCIISLAVSSFLTAFLFRSNVETKPYFIVSEMVQCKAGICNAVLEMDDIAILVPYDSTKVHIGDKIYLTK